MDIDYGFNSQTVPLKSSQTEPAQMNNQSYIIQEEREHIQRHC